MIASVLFPRLTEKPILSHLNSTQAYRDVLLVSGARQSVVNAIDSTEDFKDFEDYLRDNFNFNPAGAQEIAFIGMLYLNSPGSKREYINSILGRICLLCRPDYLGKTAVSLFAWS